MSTIPQRRAECSTPRSSPDETRVKSRCWHVTSRRPRVCRRYADPARLPATRADLEAYVDEQRHWLSLSLAAAEVTHALRKPNLWGNPVKVFTFVVVQDDMLSLLPEWARLMYGIEGRPMNLGAAARTTKRLIGIARKNESYDRMVAEVTTRIDETPYRKMRARKA